MCKVVGGGKSLESAGENFLSGKSRGLTFSDTFGSFFRSLFAFFNPRFRIVDELTYKCFGGNFVLQTWCSNVLHSFALICVLLRPTAFRATTFGNFRTLPDAGGTLSV